MYTQINFNDLFDDGFIEIPSLEEVGSPALTAFGNFDATVLSTEERKSSGNC